MENLNSLTKKQFAIIIISIVSVTVLVTAPIFFFMGLSNFSSNIVKVDNSQFAESPSYTVYYDGSQYNAKNNTGHGEFNGTDASTVINSALDTLSDTGGKVFLKEGNYSITTPITITDAKEQIFLEGSGRGTILSLADNANCHVISIDNSGVSGEEDNGCYISNLYIYGNNAHNTGSIDGIHVVSAEHPRIFMVWVLKCVNDGIYVDSICHSGFFSNIRSNNNGGYGLHLTSWFNTVTQCIADQNIRGGIEIGSYGTVTSCRLGGAGDSETGIDAEGNNMLISSNNIDSFTNGVYLAGSNSTITDNLVFKCSSYGVYLSGGTTDQKVFGNKIYDCVASIRLDTPTISHPIIMGNDWTGCADPTVSATDPIILNNIGFDGTPWGKMENSGSATNATASTFNIGHGLIGTPTGVWASFSTAAVSGWTWTANSTTMTVTVAGTGLPSSMTVYWKAEYNP
jgi:hypothetical protein